MARLLLLSFLDFHDDTRRERFRDLARQLCAETPYGDEPFYTYGRQRELPEILRPGELIYLSDVVFYSAVAWYVPSDPPDAGLDVISAYSDMAELRRNPTFRASHHNGSLIEARSESDREVFVLLDAASLDPDSFGFPIRREEHGVAEICGHWREIAGTFGQFPTAVVCESPLGISEEITAYLCREALDLGPLGRVDRPCGVLGLCHMDDSILLSIHSPFWRHQDPILRL